MTRMFGLLIALAVPVRAGDDKPVVSSIRGKWEVMAVTFNGTVFSHLRSRILEFDENFVATYADEGPGHVVPYSVDVTTDPKRIDLNPAKEGDGKPAPGIFSVEKDELKLCYAERGAGRPTKFESTPGDRVFLLILKRVKD